MLLLLGTIGPSVQMHFCGGKLFNIAVFSKAKACCDGHCRSCKDVSASYKLKDTFEKQAVEISAPTSSDLVVLETVSIPNLIASYIPGSFASTQPPPLNRTSAPFTAVFRI
ncbi:MAG: hypothetical protein WCO63_09210 [Bacteroidota bacterium]